MKLATVPTTLDSSSFLRWIIQEHITTVALRLNCDFSLENLEE